MSRPGLAFVLLLVGLSAPLPTWAQDAPEEGIRVSARWEEDPIQAVLFSLGEVAGRSIVLAPGVEGSVTATIEDQPWDAVLQAIVESQGLVAIETPSGIIRVVPSEVGSHRERSEPVVTRVYRIKYTPAEEMETTLAPLLSGRGRISVSPATNTVVISDVARVHAAVASLLH